MTTDLKRLRKLADEATPGPWRLAAKIFVDRADGTTLCLPNGDEESRPKDAAFIAAANPAAVRESPRPDRGEG